MKQETFTRPPDGDHDHGWWLIPFCFVLVAGALISTLIRLWIRMRVTRNLGWDDLMISIAMVSNRSPSPSAKLLNQRPGHNYHGERFRHRRGYRWLGKTRILPDSNATEGFRSSRLDRLRANLHYVHADQSLDLSLSTPHREYQDGHKGHVRIDRGNGSFQHDQRFPASWHLQAARCLVECEGPRNMFVETSIYEHHHCSRR